MMEDNLTLTAHSEVETEAVGARLAGVAEPGLIVFLHGELGAGKTTLVRGFLRALGVQGAVKSPTYTLVEPYRPGLFPIYHFDLYRLRDPRELEEMGIRDYFGGEAVCLVEWAERGGDVLRHSDISFTLAGAGTQYDRKIAIHADSTLGRAVLACLI